MLTRLFPYLDPARISLDLSRRLHVLADDCGRLRLERDVPARILDRAPLLQDGVPVSTPAGLHSIGYAVGHPAHRDRWVLTTPLWWTDPDSKRVRTLSRFFRLRPAADAKDIRPTFGSSQAAGPEDDA